MEINIESEKNKHGIYKIDFGKDNILIFTKTGQITFEYKQTILQIDISLGIEEDFTLDFLKNSFNETSASETFSTFRTIQDVQKKPKVTSISLTMSYFMNRFVIMIDNSFDLLLCILEEPFPFQQITYNLHNNSTQNKDILEYALKA